MAATGNELRSLDQFIYARLAADSALTALVAGRLYSEIVPQSTTGQPETRPCVLWSFISGPDTNALGSAPEQRIITRPLFVVRAVCKEADRGQLDLIADRIDAVLQGAQGSVPADNVQILGVYREESLRLIETTPEGTRWFYLGGRYRIHCSRIS